jgi:hypothetical protein
MSWRRLSAPPSSWGIKADNSLGVSQITTHESNTPERRGQHVHGGLDPQGFARHCDQAEQLGWASLSSRTTCGMQGRPVVK